MASESFAIAAEQPLQVLRCRIRFTCRPPRPVTVSTQDAGSAATHDVPSTRPRAAPRYETTTRGEGHLANAATLGNGRR